MANNKVKIVTWAVIMGLFGWICIHVYYNSQRNQLQRSHDWRMEALKDKHQEEQQVRQSRQRAELEAAWGGKMMAAVKDPDLDIAGMLRKAAAAACPSCSKVEVRVNNFIEFDVFLHVKSTIDKDAAAATMKELLAACAKYVNSASFVYGDEVVKTIDRRGIEAVRDWPSVRLATVARKMYSP